MWRMAFVAVVVGLVYGLVPIWVGCPGTGQNVETMPTASPAMPIGSPTAAATRLPTVTPIPMTPAAPTEIETFGEPWTLPEVVAELRQAGLEIQLEPAWKVEEGRWKCLPGPAIGTGGNIGGYPGGILIYPDEAKRLALWPEHGGPDVFPAGCGTILEQHAWGAGNTVVEINVFISEERGGPGYGPQLEKVRDAVLALRQD